MPTASETIPNKALAGDELVKILMEDFARLLSQDSMLAPHLAYGRIAYDITLRLHVDDPYTLGVPHTTTVASKPMGKNIVAAMPELGTLETFPLAAPSGAAMAGGERITRDIVSPNAERLRMGMPVPIDVVQRDGSTNSRTVTYPPSGEEGNVRLEDLSPEVTADVKKGKK
jgi:hypothetical protein